MASKLFVGGLSYATTSESLREYFGQCGTVESATVITDRMTGDSRGFGFVEMSTDAEAQTAISKLHEPGWVPGRHSRAGDKPNDLHIEHRASPARDGSA